MRRRFVTVLVAGLLTLAGCGGGDPEPGDAEAPAGAVAQPEPEKPITAMVEPLNRAAASGSCAQYVELVTALSREGNEAGVPPQPGECAEFEQGTLPTIEGVRFENSAEYGTGALIEGDAGEGTSVVAIWVLDTDGRFRVSYTAEGPPQIGTEPTPDAQQGETATAFVDAVREGDCEALLEVLNPGGRLAQAGGPEAVCEGVIDGALFAPAIEATPEAEPIELGATANYAFYGVPTEDAYFTLVLGTGDPAQQMTVVDLLPSSPVELPPEESPAGGD